MLSRLDISQKMFVGFALTILMVVLVLLLGARLLLTEGTVAGVQWMLVLSAVTALLAIGIVFVFSRHVTTPLRRLVAAITLLEDSAARSWRAPLDVPDTDVARLERGFNSIFAALKHSRLEWEDSFNSVTEALFVVDGKGSVTRMNHVAEGLLAMLDASAPKVVHRARFGKDGPCSECPHTAAIEGVHEVAWPGTEHVFLVGESPLRGAPEGEGAVVTIRDITDIQRMRAQVLQQEKLAVLGQTIAGVTHELNNPLASILGNAQLLARRIDNPGLRADLDLLMRDAHRAARVVRNMLTYAGHRRPEPGSTDINQLVRDTVDLHRRQQKQGAVRFELQLQDAVPEVRADAWQIQQVLLNLLVNAEQALLDDRIDPACITVRTRCDASRQAVFVEVEDNGRGIASSALGRLFDPFFTTKRAGAGMGLGLSICQTIIAQHGGTLIAGNGQQGGAIFVFRLPSASPDEATRLEPPRAAEMLRGAHILVVGDSTSETVALTGILVQIGHQVEVVERVTGVSERLDGSDYDLVISDLAMPDVYHAIRRRHPHLMRCLIFTADGFVSENGRIVLDSIEYPCVVRPYRADQVRRTVGTLLQLLRVEPQVL